MPVTPTRRPSPAAQPTPPQQRSNPERAAPTKKAETPTERLDSLAAKLDKSPEKSTGRGSAQRDVQKLATTLKSDAARPATDPQRLQNRASQLGAKSEQLFSQAQKLGAAQAPSGAGAAPASNRPAASTQPSGAGAASTAALAQKVFGPRPASSNPVLGAGAPQSPGLQAALSAPSGSGTASSSPTAQVSGAGSAPAAPFVNGSRYQDVPESATDGKILGGDGRLYDPSTPLSQIPAFQPNNGAPSPTANPAIQTNGIETNAADHFQALQDLANATGKPVVGFRNATNGFFSDVAESGLEKVGVQSAPSQGLAQVIQQQLQAGNPVDLYAHSQGALIDSSAIGQVRDQLSASGLSSQQVQQQLSNINLTTFGGASQTYPDGPNYTHHINALDPVPGMFGLGNVPSLENYLTTAPGKNATVDRYVDPELNPHSFSNYLNAVYGQHAAPNTPQVDPNATPGGQVPGGALTTPPATPTPGTDPGATAAPTPSVDPGVTAPPATPPAPSIDAGATPTPSVDPGVTAPPATPPAPSIDAGATPTPSVDPGVTAPPVTPPAPTVDASPTPAPAVDVGLTPPTPSLDPIGTTPLGGLTPPAPSLDPIGTPSLGGLTPSLDPIGTPSLGSPTLTTTGLDPIGTTPSLDLGSPAPVSSISVDPSPSFGGFESGGFDSGFSSFGGGDF